MITIAALLAVWLTAVMLLGLVYRRELRRIFAEPVFRHPVLVLESDDWGAGPLVQAAALRELIDVLGRHRDAAGRAPVLNLALVLAVVDGRAAAEAGNRSALGTPTGAARCERVMLDDPAQAPVLAALNEGRSRGVLSLQLHGLEHYRLASLLASRDAAVADWLQRDPPAATEDLPPPLQSRWVDASRLPSQRLSAAEIDAAVADEVDAYRRIFGALPQGVVPPTFVWTREVETAWAARGLRYVVTPGWRYPCRGRDGLPAGDEGPFVNGDVSSGLTCIVRCGYFEPMRGRGSEHAIAALAKAAAEGRACVLENHRANFIGDAAVRRRSIEELELLLGQVPARFPGLRFMSTAELAAVLAARDPAWLVGRWRERWPFVWQRLRAAGRLWKLLRLTGLAQLGAVLGHWLVPAPAARS